MKKVKKLLALIVAMTMVLGMAITVSADTGMATVEILSTEETAAGDTFDALYKVQIAEPDPTSPYGWKYTEDYATDFVDFSIETLIGLREKETDDNGKVIDLPNQNAGTGTIINASNLATILESLRTEVTVEDNKISGNTFTAPPGLYLVFPQTEGWTYSPTLVYVPVGSTGKIQVQAKGAENVIEKSVSDDGQSVQQGDKVQYTVTVTYPYVSSNYEDATFTITDTLNNATFITDDTNYPIEYYTLTTVTSPEGETQEKVPFDAEFNAVANDDKTSMTFTADYESRHAGTTFYISYWVEVGAVTSPTTSTEGGETTTNYDGSLSNSVSSKLDYGVLEKDPITTDKYEVVSTPVKATIEKVNENSESLNGAVFAIFRGVASEAGITSASDIDANDMTNLVAIVADAVTDTDVTLPDIYANSEKTIIYDNDADGTIVFDGLDAQSDYYVVEIVAPTGYKVDNLIHQLNKGEAPLNNPVHSDRTDVVEGESVHVDVYTYKFNDFTVKEDGANTITNTQLSSLPSTGGIGTTIFTIGGCVIMIAAAALYFVNRRKSEEN